MLGWLARASGNVRGTLWMVLAAFVFAQMNALIKYVGHDLHGFEVAFFRALFGFVSLLPVIVSAGGARVFRTDNLKMHGLRALSGGFTMLCFFYAMTHLPLANATALSFSQPLFLLALAPFLLKERVGWHRGLAAGVGGLGSLGQYLYIRAYRAGDASAVAPFNFLQLPFAAALGFVLFAEELSVATLIGGTLIVVSVLYIMRREAILHRRRPVIPV